VSGGFTVEVVPRYLPCEDARRLLTEDFMIRPIQIAATTLLVLAGAACASSQPDLVRIRAASDFSCDENRTTVRQVREVDAERTIFEARGCGRVATYACTLTTTPDINPKRKPWPATSCVPAPDDGDWPSAEAP
jgi:hypothetical protein